MDRKETINRIMVVERSRNDHNNGISGVERSRNYRLRNEHEQNRDVPFGYTQGTDSMVVSGKIEI